MPAWENLAAFFDPAEFGALAVYNGGATIGGIFDRDYVEPLGDTMQGNGPVFQCASADVPSAIHGDTLLIDGELFNVRGVEPDGTGLTLLRLEKT